MRAVNFEGIIPADRITVSSYYEEHTPLMARGGSKTSWMPATSDENPWIRVDLGRVNEVHLLSG